ncbi:MAG: hypothetical protein OER56_02965 [Hyphomicrobiales bacterium]|nr:hypothetical protein [Hyphomicrobiales bacterium]
MGGIISTIFGGGPKQQGPSEAEKAAQKQREKQAFDDKIEADKLSALSVNSARRANALSFRDERKKQRLGS